MAATPPVALITGSASGIGAATARRLAAGGVGGLVLIDRNRDGLDALRATLAVPALCIVQDVADPVAWEAAEAAMRDRFGAVDHVVASAGIAAASTIAETSYADWRHIFSVNTDGAFLTLRHTLPLLRATGRGGAVVLVSSIAAVKAATGTAAYAASKAALVQLARVAALEGAPDRIRVNAILPGGVETPIWRDVPMFQELVAETGSESAAFAKMAAAAIPLGRYAHAEEIAEQIAFLLSEAAATITGVALAADGGYAL